MNEKIRNFLLEIISTNKFLRKQNNIRLQNRFRQFCIPEEEIIIAEMSDDNKADFVKKYCRKWPEKIEGWREKLCVIKRKNTSLNYDEIDVIFCCLAYGIEPDEYFSYNFASQTSEYRKSFISDRDTMLTIFQLNDSIDVSVFNDKARTYAMYKDYYGRQAVVIRSQADKAQFLEFIEKRDQVVKKVVNQSMGKSIELIQLGSYRGKEEDLFELLLQQGKIILEEKVEQNGFMAQFNYSSVNTVRVITFNTRDGIITPYVFFKVGRRGSFVDNGGAGGILVGIDAHTGISNTDGFDEFGIRYEEHPDTRKKFRGFMLPDFTSLLDLSKELSEKMPSVKIIGWDFAYTQNGWVVIEGNGMTQLIGPQTTNQRGIKREIEEFKSKMDLIS